MMEPFIKLPLIDDTSREALKKEFEAIHKGGQIGEVSVLEDGDVFIPVLEGDLGEVPCDYRRKVLKFCPEALIGLGMLDGIKTVGSQVPLDAKVVHRYIDERGDICLIIESESFPALPPGSFYPVMEGITFQSPPIDYASLLEEAEWPIASPTR
jgi:hypothetical protein